MSRLNLGIIISLGKLGGIDIMLRSSHIYGYQAYHAIMTFSF